MKKRTKLNRVLCAILTLVLTIELLCTFSISVAKNTVGSRKFVENILEKTNFCENMRADIEKAFKNYVYQSNLDDETVKDIVTAEKIKSDIYSAVDIAYKNEKCVIETDSIKEELTTRIRKKIQNEYSGVITSKEEKDIQTLVNVIVENYSESLSVIKKTFETIAPIVKILNKINYIYLILAYVIIAITAIAMSVIYILGCKNKKVLVNKYQGIAFMTSGFVLIIVNVAISLVIKESEILIFNRAVTNILIEIIRCFKASFMTWGSILFLIGLSISICKNIMIRKYLR